MSTENKESDISMILCSKYYETGLKKQTDNDFVSPERNLRFFQIDPGNVYSLHKKTLKTFLSCISSFTSSAKKQTVYASENK